MKIVNKTNIFRGYTMVSNYRTLIGEGSVRENEWRAYGRGVME